MLTDSQMMRASQNVHKWYNANRVVMALSSVVLVAALAWGGYVFSRVNSSHDENIRQDVQLDMLKEIITKCSDRIEKQDMDIRAVHNTLTENSVKLDQVLSKIK